MRTERSTQLVLAGALSLLAMAGCTVKTTDAPAISGPSTFANNITLEATPDVLNFDPTVGSTITITARNEMGQPKALDFRAQLDVNGVVQDFGTLSAKTISTNPSTGIARLTYFPPPQNTQLASAQTVTISVYPIGTDFGTQRAASVDIRILPIGTIGPSNPTLLAQFTVTPVSPIAFTPVAFSAATTMNQGSACGLACTYNWDFGDGTTGSGLTTTHEYRTSGIRTVILTVTDLTGAKATSTQLITVAPSTPPTPKIAISPTGNLVVDRDVFVNASASTPAAGRAIVSYSWNYGDGNTASGVSATHRYRAAGSFTITLTVTDDAGTSAFATQAVTVISANPTASLTFLPSAPKVRERVVFDASASTAVSGAVIVSYTFDYGDGSPVETTTNPIQSHTYNAPGNVAPTVTVTDSTGRTATKTVAIVIAP